MIFFYVGGKMVLLHMVLQCSHSLKIFNMLKGSSGYGIDNVLGTFTLRRGFLKKILMSSHRRLEIKVSQRILEGLNPLLLEL